MTSTHIQVKTSIPAHHSMVSVLGTGDELLRLIEDRFGVQIFVRGNEITVTGSEEQAAMAVQVFEEMAKLLDTGQHLDADTTSATIDIVQSDRHPSPAEVLGDEALTHRGRAIRAKSVGQKRYLDAIRDNTVVFGIGPAGTGKTYLAMAMAVLALKRKDVNRIILTRPAVEAGERLGYLPGTLHEKIDPYLRPLFDALHDMMDAEQITTNMERGLIEVAPLAFMRGRTLNDSFIVLDEAQNTTPEQMKMFLTRIGFGSRCVVTGDVTQVDLPGGHRSGLKVVREILDGIDGVAFRELGGDDVVRHRIVQEIVEAYAAFDARTGGAGGGHGPEESRDRDDDAPRDAPRTDAHGEGEPRGAQR